MDLPEERQSPKHVEKGRRMQELRLSRGDRATGGMFYGRSCSAHPSGKVDKNR